MYSQTFLARDIFGPYWSAVLLGVLAESQPEFPLDQSLRLYAAKTASDRGEVLALIQGAGGFAPEVMDLAETEAGWAPGGAEGGFDETLVAGLLSVMVGKKVDLDFGDAEMLATACHSAATSILSDFIGALHAASFVAGHPPIEAVRYSKRALVLLGRLLGRAAPTSDISDLGYEAWGRQRLTDALTSADHRFVSWTEEVCKLLEQSR